MVVVSNTSPLTSLAAIGEFGLLGQLYTEIHIPEGVWEELNAGPVRWPGRESVAAADWVECHGVKNELLVTALRRDLDPGEAESIALALELEAHLVPMDERRAARGPADGPARGRRFARGEGERIGRCRASSLGRASTRGSVLAD